MLLCRLAKRSMLVELETDNLRATVSPVGAELRSLVLHDVEYLWPARDPWKRTAPILFPIIGRLKEDALFHDGRLYRMPQHGFARDNPFRFEQISKSVAKFTLTSDQSTLQQFPFHFILSVVHELQSDSLLSTYCISNPAATMLPASFGLHPAFRWPLQHGVQKTSYILRFERDEPLAIGRLHEGLLQRRLFASPIRHKELRLSESLFQDDAVILLNINSTQVEYQGPSGPSVRLTWAGFNDLGIWSKNPGDFVCVEPWHGYADPEGSTGEFARKPGLILLEPGEAREFTCD